MLRHLLLIFVGLGLVAGTLSAQDLQLSQFYAAPLQTNPALAGSVAGSRVGINYRSQWSTLPGGFQTSMIWADHDLPKLGGGVGLLLSRDVAGEAGYATNEAAAQYAHHVRLSEDWTLRGGLQVGWTWRRLGFNDLVFGDQLDVNTTTTGTTAEALDQNQRSYPDLGAGLLAHTDKVYLGFAAHHLLRPEQSFGGGDSFRLPIRYTLHGGVRIPTGLDFLDYGEGEAVLVPSFLFKTQGQFTQLDLGLYLDYHPIVFGLWYRGLPATQAEAGRTWNHDAITGLVGLSFDRFSFGYSYDVTISAQTPRTGGSHEVSLTMFFEPGEDRRRPSGRHRPIPCPKF